MYVDRERESERKRQATQEVCVRASERGDQDGEEGRWRERNG